MRNRLEHLQSPSAPTQPTHTHLSHTALCTNSYCTCIHTQEKHNPYFSAQIPLKSLTLTLVHTRTQTWDVGCDTSCRDRTTNMSVSGFAECKALPSQADIPPPPHFYTHPLWVLYGPILSFLLLSPRGAMAMFSCLFNDCGWTINIMHTSKHSTTPTWCCRLNSENKGKDRFSKMSLKSVLVQVLNRSTYVSCEHICEARGSLLNVP